MLKRTVAVLLALVLVLGLIPGISSTVTAAGDGVEIETDFYTAFISAEMAEKYSWDYNSFEWTYSLRFYDKAAADTGEGYKAWRFSLMMCAYASDVCLTPEAYVLGDIWIGDYCYAMLISVRYEKGTPEYDEAWDDAVEIAGSLKWKNDREFTYRTSFSWTDVYRQFVLGKYFRITDGYRENVTYYSDVDYRISLRADDGESVPELVITNGSGPYETANTYTYKCKSGTLQYAGEYNETDEDLTFWNCQDILSQGWNAFLKDLGYGLYQCEDCLNFSTYILAPVPDYSAMSAFERQIVMKAQEIYDEQMEGFSSVNNYVTNVLNRRESYERTLHQAQNYDVIYDQGWNFTKLMMTCVIGVVTQNAGTVYSVFSDVMLDYAIGNSSFADMDELLLQTLMNEVDSSVPDMNTKEFIYSQAKMGDRMISINGLREAMQKAESRGGKFFNAEDASEFITIYQYNRMGFAALSMGREFYMDELNKPSWQTGLDLLGNVVLSGILGKITRADFLSGYIQGNLLEFMMNKLDGIVGQYGNERITKWRDEIRRISEETKAIFTPPVTFDIVRENGLINYADSYSGEYAPYVPEIPEDFTFYRDFAVPDTLAPETAADYLEIAEERINLYGMEHMTVYNGVKYGFKTGLSGGYLTDLNQDGTPEMILAVRDREGSYQDPSEAQYEIWTWEDGIPYEIFYGDLERINSGSMDEKAEYLNIWIGTDATYLEMGYVQDMYRDIDPETMSLERWFMTYDAEGWFRRMDKNPPDKNLVRRVPVAAGNQIHLANANALLEYLAEQASALADNDPAEVLKQTKYYGDPDCCTMSGRMASAYAENLMAESSFNPDSTEGHFLQAILVDVGDDGYPFLIKTMPSPWRLYWPDGSAHFIGDAMFCYFDGERVREYPFLNDVEMIGGWSEYPPQYSISLINREQRGGQEPVLKVTVSGYLKGTRSGASETLYYFASEGELELFHRYTVVYSYPEYTYYWDGVSTDDPDGCLYSAALEYNGEDFFFIMNQADQNAVPGRTGITTAKMLQAYAANVSWENTTSGRDYSNWAAGRGSIRSVELAYLSAYANDASSKNTVSEMRDCMFEQLKSFPADHPLHTDDNSTKSNLNKNQITAIRSGTNGSMDAIVLKLSDKRAIVIYGGTQGAQLDDIFSDIGITVKGTPVVGNAYGFLSAINPVSWFMEDQFEAASKVITDLENEGFETIIVTGHSLGGHLAVDVTLNHESIDECMAFDPPGRGDAWYQSTFNGDRIQKITTYKAAGSIVSMVGTQVGRRIIDLTVEKNKAGIFPNHDIIKIAEALGGMKKVREK